MRRAPLAVVLATGLVAAAAFLAYLRQDYRPAFARAAGTLVAVVDSTGVGRAPDGQEITDVTLVSDTGLRVKLRVRAPGGATGERHPAALVVGGLKTGRRAVEVPPETGGVVLASIEYPYDGPRGRLSAWQWIRWLPAMRRAVLQTPAALLVAAQYLYAREDVDPDRVSVIGVSVGVPFAVAAAATDRRLAGAALLDGGGDIRRLFARAWGNRIGEKWLGPAALAVAWILAPLEPVKYVGSIAPRPVLVVAADDDAVIPRSSVLELYRAAREPRRMVWVRGRHVAASDEERIARRMRIILQWMEERGLR